MKILAATFTLTALIMALVGEWPVAALFFGLALLLLGGALSDARR